VTLVSSRLVRIQVCRPLAVERDGQRLDGLLPGRQGRLLFAYLVVNRHRQVPRDELAEALCGNPTRRRSMLGLIRCWRSCGGFSARRR
jgi:DNA-binding SARP family transcriptional activator